MKETPEEITLPKDLYWTIKSILVGIRITQKQDSRITYETTLGATVEKMNELEAQLAKQDSDLRLTPEEYERQARERLKTIGMRRLDQLAKQVCPELEREIRTIILPLCPNKERRERAIARILRLCQGKGKPDRRER